MPAPTPRTTAALVMGIITVKAGVDLTPFIAMGNEITTDICGNSGYTDGYVGSRMELIERWLSAHFYTIFANRLHEAKAGTVHVTYQNVIDYGLRASMYGQQAIILDTDGNLAAFNNTAQTKRHIVVGIFGPRRRWWNCFPGLIGDGTEITVEQ